MLYELKLRDKMRFINEITQQRNEIFQTRALDLGSDCSKIIVYFGGRFVIYLFLQRRFLLILPLIRSKQRSFN